jgi:hypothetical protein
MTERKDSQPDLATVKATLAHFAATRAHRTPAELEHEFGALLLYLVRLASTLDIDLMRAGETAIDRAATTRLRLLAGDPGKN